MSQNLHKHYFPPVCILTHCWCCGLRSAVVTAACVTSFLAACGFVFAVHGLVFGVYATGSYYQENYMEKKFNNSMYEGYRKFNRSADHLCLIRHFLTSTEGGDDAQRRRRPKSFNLDRVRPALYDIFTEDEIAKLGNDRLDYGTEYGRQQARHFWHAYRKWRMRRIMRKNDKIDTRSRKKNEPALPSLYNYHALMAETQSEDDSDDKKGGGGKKDVGGEQLCHPPYLVPRVRVDHKMNVLRIALFGKFLLRTHNAVIAICAMDLVACIATLVACILLIWGVMQNKPTLIAPWLVITPYFILFNVVFVDIRVCMILVTRQSPDFAPYISPIIFLLSGLVLVFILLALFSVASYLYLTYTTDFYLHQYPRSTQVVASGTTDTLAADEMAEIMRSMKALRKAKTDQKT